MKSLDERKFLIILLLSSLVLRLVIAPLYLAPPNLPIDFYAYANAGEAIINGTWNANLYPTMDIRNISTYMGPYGPLLGSTYAPILALFGKDYLLMKLPSILFDTLNVLLVYLIAKNLKGENFAKYVSIFYAFSYLIVYSAAAEGNNDNYELFWVLLSVFLILKPNPNIILSAISMGIAAGYVFIPFVILLPIMYYFYQTNKSHEIPKYLLIFMVTFILILLPFYRYAGLNVLHPYLGPWIQFSNWPPPTHSTDGMSIANLIKMLSYFFIFGSNKPYNTYVFPEGIATISILVGFAFAFWYVWRYRLEDKRLELIRNMFMLFFIGLVFFREFYFLNMPWLFTMVIILLNINKSQITDFSLSRPEAIGILLIISGTIIHAAIYRWLINYTLMERILLLIGIMVVTAGTYLTFINTTVKKSWTLVMLTGVSFNIMDARFLVLLGGFIPLFQNSRYSWGIYYFTITVLMIPLMFFLLKEIHNSTQSSN